MKKLLVLSMVMLAAVAGCNSSTSDDDGDKGSNTNNTGNGGAYKVFGAAKLNSADGAGISGATVKLTGTNTNLSAATGSDGSYAFSNIANGAYKATITKSNYTFNPSEVDVVVNGKDVVVQAFVGTTSSGGNTGGAGSNNLYPLKLGASWTYDDIYGDSTFESAFVDRIIGTKVQGGKTYWMLETSFPSESYSYSDTTLVRIEGNVFYGFWSASMFTKPVPKTAKKAVAAKAASIARAAISAYGLETPLFKFGQSAGATWSIYDTGVYQGNSVVVTGKYIGTESVTVPAGTFANCAKYEMKMVIKLTDADTKQVETTTSTLTTWLAPGVGIVKETDYSTFSEDQEIDDYVSISVLRTYSIP